MLSSTWPPLLEAAHRGDFFTAANLLAASANQSERTERGDSAVHLCAHAGHAGVLDMLLTHSAEMANATNLAGWTPLMLAMLSDAPTPTRIGCCRVLLAHGADGGLTTPHGWTAGLLAAQRGDAAALALLLGPERRVGPAALLSARTAEGDSALHLASHAGSARCVRLLLCAGADADALNCRGLDALALAVGGACAPEANFGDAATAAAEELLACLAAASCAPRPSGKLLHILAAAPAQVPMRRLLALAALLRRCGCEDDDDGAGSPAHKAASARAMRHGRSTLAAVLRAPPPAPFVLALVRRPLEGTAPPSLLLLEGARETPELEAEPAALRQATLLAMRSADAATLQGGGGVPGIAVGGGGGAAEQGEMSPAAAAAAIEADAAATAAAALLGGGRRRARAFRWIGEVAAPSADAPFPDLAMLQPLVMATAAARRQACRSPDLATACARALALASLADTTTDGAMVGAAAADACAAATGQAHCTASPATAPLPDTSPATSAGAAALADEMPTPAPATPATPASATSATSAATPASTASAALAAMAATAAARGGRAAYRQRRRWSDDAERLEVVELAPQTHTPLVHDIHLAMLREVLGAAALDDDDDGGGGGGGGVRPWAVYAEDLAYHSPGAAMEDAAESAAASAAAAAAAASMAGTGVTEGIAASAAASAAAAAAAAAAEAEAVEWAATAEVFSLDTALLLAFAAESAERRRRHEVAALRDEEGLAMEESEDEGEDGARVVPVDGEDLELAHDAMAMSLTLCDGCDS